MAVKKTTRNQPDLHLQTLKAIQATIETQIGGLRGEMQAGFGGLRDDIRRLEARSASLEDAVNQGFAFLGARVDGVGARVDHLRDNIGGAYRSHDERLTALERRVFRRDDDEDDDGDA